MQSDHIAIIKEARDREVTIRFLYENLEGVITRRIVDPAKVVGDQLLGWCCHREEMRRFAFCRMHNVELGPSANDIHLPLGEPEEIGR